MAPEKRENVTGKGKKKRAELTLRPTYLDDDCSPRCLGAPNARTRRTRRGTPREREEGPGRLSTDVGVERGGSTPRPYPVRRAISFQASPVRGG